MSVELFHLGRRLRHADILVGLCDITIYKTYM